MKHITLIALLFSSIAFGQYNWHLGTSIATAIPNKNLAPKMSTNVGWGFQFGYRPIHRLPIALEWQSVFGSYGMRTLTQTYQFTDGTQTITDVNYYSGMKFHTIGTRIQIGNDYRLIRGFVTPQLGWAKSKSRIYIEDPNDTDGCEALDQETVHRYRGGMYGGEIGMEVDLHLFGKNAIEENTHFLFVSANYMRSFKDFEYINIKYMHDHTHGYLPDGGATLSVNEDGRDVNARFINVTTQEIHEHKIAEVYKTGLEYWGFKIGYVAHF